MKKPAIRRDVTAQKEALAAELRAMERSSAHADDVMVSVRDLSTKYGLSLRTVSLELQKLSNEGVLYTIPRVGTFIGSPHKARRNLFVAVFSYSTDENGQFAAVRSGFEERIARLGGTSLIVDSKMALHYRNDSEFAKPAGIFEFYGRLTPSVWSVPDVPHAEFGEIDSDKPNTDMVYFDNVVGGRTATRHLISLGHRSIAYLGLHPENEDAGFFVWSKKREEGWHQTMTAAGCPTEGLAYHPSEVPNLAPKVAPQMLMDIVYESARALARRQDISAIVCSSSLATETLFKVLREENRPIETWPAIVSFDTGFGEGDPAISFVTTLRLPWEEIGREAANILWERSQGVLTGAPQQRLVSMSLIPRLSCRQEWHSAPSLTTRRKNRIPVAI